jgi:hypothetical protein
MPIHVCDLNIGFENSRFEGHGVRLIVAASVKSKGVKNSLFYLLQDKVQRSGAAFKRQEARGNVKRTVAPRVTSDDRQRLV